MVRKGGGGLSAARTVGPAENRCQITCSAYWRAGGKMAGVMTDDAQQRGREAFERQEWGKAFEQLQAADHVQFLAPDDLVRLATAAYLNGNQAAAAVIWARAHHDFLTQRNITAAARSAFWLGFTALLQGEQAPASGWLGRGSRLLEE